MKKYIGTKEIMAEPMNECETTCGSCCKEHENKTIKNNHNYESKNKKDR